MFKIGDYLIYRKDVCKVKDIIDKDNILYYRLELIDDPSLKIETPVENNDNNIKELVTKDEIHSLIGKLVTTEVLDCNERMLELEYKNLLSTGNKDDLIKVIKTAYIRNRDRIANKKKANERDINYYEKAEKMLINEFRVVLNLTYEETKEYILNEVKLIEV